MDVYLFRPLSLLGMGLNLPGCPPSLENHCCVWKEGSAQVCFLEMAGAIGNGPVYSREVVKNREEILGGISGTSRERDFRDAVPCPVGSRAVRNETLRTTVESAQKVKPAEPGQSHMVKATGWNWSLVKILNSRSLLKAHTG